MANITVQLPKALDKDYSVETIAFDPVSITTDMTIVDALQNKNNSLVIVVDASTAGKLIIKAGNHYPNKILGDYKVTCTTGTTVIRLQDISRFENKDNTIKVQGDGTLAGTIFATAKRAGIMPKLDQDAVDGLV